MHICPQCHQEQGELAEPTHRDFPAFAVTGGALAGLAAAATGALLLIPAGLLVGAVVDRVRRCALCGAQAARDEETFRLVEEQEDESGRRFVRPVVRPFTDPESFDLEALPTTQSPSSPDDVLVPAALVHDAVSGMFVPDRGSDPSIDIVAPQAGDADFGLTMSADGADGDGSGGAIGGFGGDS